MAHKNFLYDENMRQCPAHISHRGRYRRTKQCHQCKKKTRDDACSNQPEEQTMKYIIPHTGLVPVSREKDEQSQDLNEIFDDIDTPPCRPKIWDYEN